MRGLLEKDFRLLKSQLKTLVPAVVFVVFLLLFTGNSTFGMAYFTFFAAALCFNTVTYDEFEKGYSYLFTLPVSRRGYVMEKYVLGMLLVGFSFVLGAALTGAVRLFMAGNGTADFAETLAEALIFLAGGVVVLASQLPVYLKYGVEKGRIMIMLVYLVLGAVLGGGIYFLFKTGFVPEHWLQSMGSLSTGILAAGAVLFLLLLLGGSMAVSFRIMERKEF